MAALALIFVGALFTSATSGSIVTFEKSPDVIQTILTRQMTLTCSVNDTMTSQSGSLVGRRSVTQTKDNVMYVTSMVVQHNGQEVATITPFSPPTALVDKDKLNVTGSLTTNNGERGHLTLTWSYPDELQSGNYTCEVNGIDARGHSVTTNASLSMSVRNPTVSDLTKHVHDQEVKIEEQIMKNKELQKQLDNQKSYILQQVDSKLLKLEQEMTNMAVRLNESGHVENGSVMCGGSSGWSTLGGYKTKDMTKQFQSHYKNLPIVHLSPVRFEHSHTHRAAGTSYPATVDFWVELVEVTATNFTLTCKTKTDPYRSNNIMYFNIDWISVP